MKKFTKKSQSQPVGRQNLSRHQNFSTKITSRADEFSIGEPNGIEKINNEENAKLANEKAAKTTKDNQSNSKGEDSTKEKIAA